MLLNGSLLQNRYRIKRLLAQGGMGAVYEAEAVHLGGIAVALKQTLFGEDQQFLRDQFQLEAKTLARLKHNALPRVSDHFIDEAGQFLVMDFIPGDDLGALLERRGKAFEPSQVMDWADTLLDALEYIHTQNPPIIHRDIKPQNVKLTPQGELYLLDFGLAKGAATTTQAHKSLHAYTAAYAPPEQIKREGTDARSDLFSLAATLYHLVTNEIPKDSRLREEFLRHSMPDPLAPAHQFNPSIPVGFSTVIERALALDRDRRHNSAAEMRQALRQARRTIAEDPQPHDMSRRTQSNNVTTFDAEGEARRLREEDRRREVEEQRVQEAAHLAARQRIDEDRTIALQREVEETRRFPDAQRPNAGTNMISLGLGAPPIPRTEPVSAPARSHRLAILGAALSVPLAGLIGWQLLKNDGGPAQPGGITPTSTATATPAPSPGQGIASGGISKSAGNAIIPTPPPRDTASSGNVLPGNSVRNIKSDYEGAQKPSSTPTPGPTPMSQTSSSGVLAGRAITRVQPAYPAIAVAARASGPVHVRVAISEEGKVISAVAIDGHPLLRSAAVAAARQWVFEPAKLSGLPVKTQGVLTFNFQSK
jgi:TonB family protein